MPRGLYNWTFSDIVKVLTNNGFSLRHIKGIHYYYVASRARVVQVPFHGKNKALKPRTLKGIIRQSELCLDLWTGRNEKQSKKR